MNAIRALAKSGGATTAVGVQGAWYTLSPEWQNEWPDPNAGAPNTPALPLPYNTRNMRKVVVMLTDGENNWQGAYTSGSRYVRSTAASGSAPGPELLYNAYGRAADWSARFPGAQISPVTQNKADERLNERFTAVCEAMKEKDIIIYIIGFEVSSANRKRLESCATSPDHYFESPTAAQLHEVFTEVANRLAGLRLAE